MSQISANLRTVSVLGATLVVAGAVFQQREISRLRRAMVDPGGPPNGEPSSTSNDALPTDIEELRRVAAEVHRLRAEVTQLRREKVDLGTLPANLNKPTF